MANKRVTHAAKYFAKVAALNKLIDKGGNEAKDAVSAKVNFANSSALKIQTAQKKKNKGKKSDLLDSRAMLPGSYESGKRR